MQLHQMLHEFGDLFEQSEDDIGLTHCFEHEIHKQGPPVRLPYHRQNPWVWEEEENQVQQILRQGVI